MDLNQHNTQAERQTKTLSGKGFFLFCFLYCYDVPTQLEPPDNEAKGIWA